MSTTPEKAAQEKKPNETGGVSFLTHFKIFDPKTKEVLVQQRGDN